MSADEKLLEAVSSFLTTYSIESAGDVKKLDAYLASLGVKSPEDFS